MGWTVSAVCSPSQIQRRSFYHGEECRARHISSAVPTHVVHRHLIMTANFESCLSAREAGRSAVIFLHLALKVGKYVTVPKFFFLLAT